MILAGRNHPNPQFNLNGGQPRGPGVVVRAANDSIQPPTEPRIVAALEVNLCQCKVGHNCFVVWNPYGDEREVPYNATVEDWDRICKELLDAALERTNDVLP